MKMIGLARLGRDAETRYLPDGTAVANLSLAVNYFSKDAENNRATQWIEASLWGKQADTLAQYMVKGSVHCFALSDIHMETFQGKNGEGHKLVARVDSIELGPRQDAHQGQQPQRQAPQQGYDQQQAPRQQAQRQAPPQGQAPRQAAPQQRQAPQRGGSGFDDMDDDIPF